MFKYIGLVLLLSVMLGCGSSSNAPINITIKIVASDPHPFLKDHKRTCIITDGARELDRFELYPDTGGGSSVSNLYRDKTNNQLVLIDQNGTWFYINPNTGRLIKQQWRWKSPTPKDYLGSYVCDDNSTYRFIDRESEPEPPIYWFKDPND